MLALIITVSVVLPFSLGFTENSLEFSVKYFKERNAPFVCLITCDHNKLWNTKFVKAATDQSIGVSVLDTSRSWQDKIDRCMLQKFTNIGVLMEAECHDTTAIFYAASQEMWFDFRHIWLILHETNKLEINNKTTVFNSSERYEVKLFEKLENMNISVDADIVLATLSDHNMYKLYDIFNFGKPQGGDLKVVDIGSWSKGNGLVANLNGCKYYRRWDFGQWKMRLVSVITSPLDDFVPEMLTSLSPVPGVSVVTRTSTIILMIVAEVHNFKFVHKVTDRWIGSFETNSTRVAANTLYFREQDVTPVFRFWKTDKFALIHPSLTFVELESCRITPEWKDRFRQLNPFCRILSKLNDSRTRFYYRIPTTGPGKYENQFLRPLSDGVWWSLTGISVIGMTLLVLAAGLERRPSSVEYAFFSVVANVSQQYFEDEVGQQRSSTARKLTIFVTGICCVLVYNYYTSSVVSWLLNGPPPSLNSLWELLESPLDIILEDIGYTRTWLNDTNYYYTQRRAAEESALRKKILGKKNGMPIVKPVEEGIAMVKAGGYAYHTEPDMANRLISKTFTQSELCEVGSLESMEKTLLYVALQINSPYKEFLTWSLTRLLERGIVSCIQSRTLFPPISCKASMPRALALGGAAPAFILLAFGFILATTIMYIERLMFKLHVNHHGLMRKAVLTQDTRQNPMYIRKHRALRSKRFTNEEFYD